MYGYDDSFIVKLKEVSYTNVDGLKTKLRVIAKKGAFLRL
jgi:hypothetical protein